jgi:predicted transcriptional regulator
MADIILSIHPKWAQKIYSGEKIFEVRKTELDWFTYNPDHRPLIYLYETSPIKKITGLVFLHWIYGADRVQVIDAERCIPESLMKGSCLSQEELIKYSSGKDLYFWQLKDPFKFDVPQDLKGSVPQSWRYLKKGEFYY